MVWLDTKLLLIESGQKNLNGTSFFEYSSPILWYSDSPVLPFSRLATEAYEHAYISGLSPGLRLEIERHLHKLRRLIERV